MKGIFKAKIRIHPSVFRMHAMGALQRVHGDNKPGVPVSSFSQYAASSV